MPFRLTPRSMTLDDLEVYNYESSENFWGFRKFRMQQFATATCLSKRMKIDQYCQRQRCKHVELEQFFACFRVALVCQRQLGFLVIITYVENNDTNRLIKIIINVYISL